MNTIQRMVGLLAHVLRIDERDVTLDVPVAQLFARYGGSSLDHVEFVMAVEEQFEGKLSDEDAELLQRGSVRQIAALIDSK